MVEKKTVAIAVLCVVIVLCLRLWSNSAQEAQRLEGELWELTDNYEALKGDYEEIYSIFNASKAIAESAEWISDDERLTVTSEPFTSPSLIMGITYSVRVNVTNVGDKPIDKVLIFLVTYKDGKFTEGYLYGQYSSYIVENLYIGETYSHDFTVSPGMTSYKVLAVAG